MSIPDGHTLFTSESVTEGHPDKLCDAIADAVLDDVPVARPCSRARRSRWPPRPASSSCIGEMTTQTYCDVQSVVRDTVRQVGYDDARLGFDWETCGTITAIKEQSPGHRARASTTPWRRSRGSTPTSWAPATRE